MSVSTENFVKIIYQYEQNNSLDTRPGSIARALGISNAAATDMARKLADKALVQYEKYQELKLTKDGEKLALSIIRKHRLWETFLHRIFNLSLHEIHREAELLEHQTSDFLAERLSDYLGNPGFDPHGDPIPDSEGCILLTSEYQLLSTAASGYHYKITRLSSSDKDFFDFCNNNDLVVGAVMKVEHQYASNNMTEITVSDVKLLLNKDFTNIIYVKQTII